MWHDILTQIFNWVVLLLYSILWICVIYNKRFIMVIAKMKQDREDIVQDSEKTEIMKILNGDIRDCTEKEVFIFIISKLKT